MAWTTAKLASLQKEVYNKLNQNDNAAFIADEDLVPIAKMPQINEKPYRCALAISKIYSQHGLYFALIGEIRTEMIKINKPDWHVLYPTIRRPSAPNFERNRMARDRRNPCEFVPSREGALDGATDIGTTESTVNDELIPVDVFGEACPDPPHGGRPTEGADKAHLLPKERSEALTWNYVAVAVLGLNMQDVNKVSTQKAILGCSKTLGQRGKETTVRYPGIRNLLCNIMRMTGQQNLFDQKPRVFVLPALSLEDMRDWQGRAYDAIILCENGWIATQIGMNRVELEHAKKATKEDMEVAMSTASSICQFLAHCVLQKTKDEVEKYQKSNLEKENHGKFRLNRMVPQLRGLEEYKPVCLVSFAGHGSDSSGHPAPDPILLACKSCNNLLLNQLGFRMLANADPPELDDLSKEGEQNLLAYVDFQAQEEQAHRHDELMNMEISCGPNE